MRRALWAAIFVFQTATAQAGSSAEGLWQTIDDTTGQPASILRTYLQDGKLFGKVERVLDLSRGPNPLCDKCDDERKGKPVIGMVVMWDLQPDGEWWTGGHVLDPKNGTTYRCKVRPVGDDALEVRGYVGISLFGRTQTWHRLPTPSDPGKLPSG